MPNIAQLMKTEIIRLSKREINAALKTLRRDNIRLKRDVAALKRQGAKQAKDAAFLLAAERRRVQTAAPAVAQDALKKIRPRALTIKKLRERCGLSRASLGRLLKVHEMTVYEWEKKTGNLKLKPEVLAMLVQLRAMSVRDVQRLLAELPVKKAAKVVKKAGKKTVKAPTKPVKKVVKKATKK